MTTLPKLHHWPSCPGGSGCQCAVTSPLIRTWVAPAGEWRDRCGGWINQAAQQIAQLDQTHPTYIANIAAAIRAYAPDELLQAQTSPELRHLRGTS